MTVPTFTSFMIVITGWVFARHRTVTAMIQAADAVGSKHHSAFHRVFAAARWSRDELGLAIFEWIVVMLNGVIFLGLDDTLARKRGLKIFGVGMHHDPLLSTRKVKLTNWGHSWVVLGVIIRLPFCSQRYFCLPILFRLYISKQTTARQGGVYRTRPELAVEMLKLLCGRYEHRLFHVLTDSTYGGRNVLLNLPGNCDLTSRLGLDARLYEAPPRPTGKQGRPRKRGARLPAPRQMLAAEGRHLTLAIYGRKDRSRVVDTVAYLHVCPDRPVRVVAVEPLSSGRTLQAFYSTRSQASARQVLTWYAMRWSLEESFQASKSHLGFEEPQGWSRQAVERTAPTALLLYSLIVLWFANHGYRYYRLPHAPWYRQKAHASFADMLATLRQESVREEILSLRPSGRGSRKLLKTLIHAVQQAA